MDARVNETVQLALSQRGTTGSHPDVVISLGSQPRSSCASTAAPNVQVEQQPQIEPTAVDDQRYPVDDVTMPTPCELLVRARNISIHVAYGLALPLNPSTTIHGRPIPPARYIKEQLKPKVPPPREKVPLELGKKASRKPRQPTKTEKLTLRL